MLTATGESGEKAGDCEIPQGVRRPTLHQRRGDLLRWRRAAGVAAVAVHGRTREQYYSGKADWNIIREVKKAVKIPVIGNGDAFTPQDAKRLVEETGCDGIMVARGAKGNPWIFKQITHYLENGRASPETFRGGAESHDPAPWPDDDGI